MIWNVLFLCTGNSCRSIMAEALLNKLGAGRFRAYSAGSSPVGTVNPNVLQLLKRRGFDTSALRSKSWEEFERPDSVKLDFAITVCYPPAGEVCPIWPGQPLMAQWGMSDPADASGTRGEIEAAFAEAYRTLELRARLFTGLKMEHLDRMSLQKSVEDIAGRMP